MARLWPVFGSQNLMGCWLSLLPETTNPFVGCQSTHFTSAPWPVKETKIVHSEISQTEKLQGAHLITNVKLNEKHHRAQVTKRKLNKISSKLFSLLSFTLINGSIFSSDHALKSSSSEKLFKKVLFKSVLFF